MGLSVTTEKLICCILPKMLALREEAEERGKKDRILILEMTGHSSYAFIHLDMREYGKAPDHGITWYWFQPYKV